MSAHDDRTVLDAPAFVDSIPPAPVRLSVPPLHARNLPAGFVLDKTYRVLERLGAGGMGAVYLVEHVGLGRRFAAKVVACTAGDSTLARFRREARTLSMLDHPNIVEAVHLGQTAEGLLYIVMKRLEGESLRERLRRDEGRRLPDAEVKAIAPQLFSAMATAHAKGVVHRDLKPDNLFLARTHGGVRLKVLDFGISKLGAAPITHVGQLLGTPLYMAPEQSRGERRLDHRADIYAMGVILYELLTGQVPFTASSLQGLTMMHACDRPRPLREHRSVLPEAVEQVVLRCLEKHPADRFASVDELAEAWERAWEPAAPEPPPPTRGPSWIRRLVVAGLVLVALAAAYGVGRHVFVQSSEGAATTRP